VTWLFAINTYLSVCRLLFAGFLLPLGPPSVVGRCCWTVLLRSWRFVILYGRWLRVMAPSSAVGSFVYESDYLGFS